jgi:hypothetical protein
LNKFIRYIFVILIFKAPFAGIMGLGFPKIAAAHTIPTFDNMMK